MTISPAPISATTIKRLIGFRKARRMTQTQLAEGLTACGFPITRSSLARVESMAVASVPVDLVWAASQFFRTTWQGFYEGAFCERCGDTPPVAMTCNVCLKPGPKGDW